jgi:hypothetical protein
VMFNKDYDDVRWATSHIPSPSSFRWAHDFLPSSFLFHLWNLDRLGLGLGLGWALPRWAWTNPPLFLSSLTFIPSTCTCVVEPDHPSESLTSLGWLGLEICFIKARPFVVRLELPFRWIDNFIFMAGHVF